MGRLVLLAQEIVDERKKEGGRVTNQCHRNFCKEADERALTQTYHCYLNSHLRFISLPEEKSTFCRYEPIASIMLHCVSLHRFGLHLVNNCNLNDAQTMCQAML